MYNKYIGLSPFSSISTLWAYLTQITQNNKMNRYLK